MKNKGSKILLIVITALLLFFVLWVFLVWKHPRLQAKNHCGQEAETRTVAEILPEEALSGMESITFLDFNEDWYQLGSDEPAFSGVLPLLRKVEGVEIEPLDDTPAGWYLFSVTYNGAAHDLNLTAADGAYYAGLDGTMYAVTEDLGEELAKYLRQYGQLITKEEWSKTMN